MSVADEVLGASASRTHFGGPPYEAVFAWKVKSYTLSPNLRGAHLKHFKSHPSCSIFTEQKVTKENQPGEPLSLSEPSRGGIAQIPASVSAEVAPVTSR